MDQHADKIGKELLSKPRHPFNTDLPPQHGKRVWDDLCALLVDLGTPVGVPELCKKSSRDPTAYHELMSRYAEQSTASVQNLFVETPPNDQVCCLFITFITKRERLGSGRFRVTVEQARCWGT